MQRDRGMNPHQPVHHCSISNYVFTFPGSIHIHGGTEGQRALLPARHFARGGIFDSTYNKHFDFGIVVLYNNFCFWLPAAIVDVLSPRKAWATINIVDHFDINAHVFKIISTRRRRPLLFAVLIGGCMSRMKGGQLVKVI